MGQDDQAAPFMTISDAVIALLRDLRVGSKSTAISDDRTFALVEDICTQLIRQKFTELGATEDDQGNDITITATSNNKEIVLATLTSSEIMNSAPSLAAHLLHMLTTRSYEPPNMAKSSPSEKHPQPEPRLDVSGYLSGARDQSQNQSTAISVLSAQALGSTYPSELLDETRGSCCSIPALNSI